MNQKDPSLEPFRVEVVEFQQALAELRAVRDEVFVGEQNVPVDLEHDALDPISTHVIARVMDSSPVGTGRLTTERHIGRMAVLAQWRGRGVGDALLLALVEQARQRGWQDVHLNAQVSALGFYERHGFQPEGERFMEAGIEHQAMRRTLDGPRKIERQQEAIETVTSIITSASRMLWIRSFTLDPGLLDAPDVMQAPRTFATSGRGNEVRILLHDAASPQTNHAPLLALAQRLPACSCSVNWSTRKTVPTRPHGSPVMPVAITCAGSVNASKARPNCTRRRVVGSCGPVTTRHGNVRGPSRNTARWACSQLQWCSAQAAAAIIRVLSAAHSSNTVRNINSIRFNHLNKGPPPTPWWTVS